MNVKKTRNRGGKNVDFKDRNEVIWNDLMSLFPNKFIFLLSLLLFPSTIQHRMYLQMQWYSHKKIIILFFVGQLHLNFYNTRTEEEKKHLKNGKIIVVNSAHFVKHFCYPSFLFISCKESINFWKERRKKTVK